MSTCELPHGVTQQNLLIPFTAKSTWWTGSSFSEPFPMLQICHDFSETLLSQPTGLKFWRSLNKITLHRLKQELMDISRLLSLSLCSGFTLQSTLLLKELLDPALRLLWESFERRNRNSLLRSHYERPTEIKVTCKFFPILLHINSISALRI